MIPLPDFLIEYLDQNLIFSKSRHFIFSRTGAAPVDPRTIQLFYKQTLEELQIPYLNFHCLRHTFATRCITMGWDVRTLSEVLGHSDIKITMEYYFHSSMEYKKLQMQLQLAAVAGAEVSNDDTQRFQQIGALLFAGENTSRFLLLEMRLQQTMADVFKTLSDAAGLDMPGM